MQDNRKIVMKPIPHGEQRYKIIGDYWEDKKTINYRVSQMTDWRYQFLVLLHEFIELNLLKQKGVSIDDVDAFDIKFEAERLLGKHTPEEEPGDAKDAPYRKEHALATKIERILAKKLGVNWREYDLEMMRLLEGENYKEKRINKGGEGK